MVGGSLILQASGPATAQLVERVVSLRFDELPSDVIEIAKHSILDCLGVTLAGSREPLAKIVAGALGPVVDAAAGQAETATIIGHEGRLSLADAALANGTAAHALDYDDTHPVLEGHPSAPVLPAALAVGEALDASGSELLTAFLAGLECECMLGAIVNPGHYGAGWHATATLGRFGAAAACARLYGLEAEAIGHALGLAGVQAAGLQCVFGTMAKPFQVGKAAADGLLSALLAGRGLRSNSSIIEADRGFARLYAAGGADGAPLSGDDFYVRSTLFKFHAACHMAHPTIEALSQVQRAHELAEGDVRRVELHLTDPVRLGCGIAEPTTGLEAKFSVRAAAALVLIGADTADPFTFVDSCVTEERFKRALNRVEVIPVENASGWTTRVRVLTTDGRTLAGEADVGQPATDLGAEWQRLGDKFLMLARPVLGEPGAQRLLDAVSRIETIASVRDLTALCVPK